MILFFLGFVSGLIISIILFLIEWYLSPSYRPMKRLESILPKQKGTIIEEEDENKKKIEKVIKENDEKGLDTYLDDLYGNTERS